jgi:TnpA family transposase
MPVDFLTNKQKENYGIFPKLLDLEILHKYFHLDDYDKSLIGNCRRNYNKLGYALQLTTVRFIGVFLANPLEAPEVVKSYLASQLGIKDFVDLDNYLSRKVTRYEHISEIKEKFGYHELNDVWLFRLSRWLYTQCWYSTERPSILFDRAVSWLTERKLLLPGITTLTRLISRVRVRSDSRLWRILSQLPSITQIESLKSLLKTEENQRYSELDRLKSAPTRISSYALIAAIKRYKKIKSIGIRDLDFAKIPIIKIRGFARYITTSWTPSILRMPEYKKIAMLVSFAYIYEIQALDDVLNLLDMLISEIISSAKRIGEKNRLRTLGDLDKSASELAEFAQLFLDNESKKDLPKHIYNTVPKQQITNAITTVKSLTRKNHDKYFEEMLDQYAKVRRFLPSIFQAIDFKSTQSGRNVYDAIKFLHSIDGKKKSNINGAPKGVISESWSHLVLNKDNNLIDRAGYTLCVLDSLQSNMRSKDLFIEDSEKWCDPRTKLISGNEWFAKRNHICKLLRLPIESSEAVILLSNDLNLAYLATLNNSNKNDNLKIVLNARGKKKIQISKLEKIEEPESLISLRAMISDLLPQIELPELLMEVNRFTGFAAEFTHISESESKMKDLDISICAVLMAEACNIGYEPLIKNNEPALSRARLSWVQQNYFSSENIEKSNARLVDYHIDLPLTQKIGNGDIVSGDGLRFACAVKSVNSGPNKKYFNERGLTYYNLTSGQFTGSNGLCVPGTLKDSLYVLDVITQQRTKLDFQEVMVDTAGTSEIVFALFWLLGYQFSPRIADTGSARFWRIDSTADYSVLNDIAKHKASLKIIIKHWDDALRIAASLKLGYVSASELIRSLFKNNRPSSLAKALINIGRVRKTIHMLRYIDDDEYRRHILTQLNKGESRHSIFRAIYHGKKGEIYKHYKENQEDQLNSVSLVTNAIVIWNTIYIHKAEQQLKENGTLVKDTDIARISPLMNKHINILGKFSFVLPESVRDGNLRELNELKFP